MSTEGSTGVLDRQRDDLSEPPKFNVILHNDDYTPQDFVVRLLQSVFNHDVATAYVIMMSVHNLGSGIAGTFPREVAEAKVAKAKSMAEGHGHPLEITFERA